MPNPNLKTLSIALALAFVLALGCSRRPTSTAEVPHLLPSSYRITVAPFTQPIHPGQLITGHIPEDQGRIPYDTLRELDRALRDTLMADTKRQYNFITARNLPRDWTTAHSTGQPGALGPWLAYGREHDARLLLVPQVLDWHERQGSEGGVTDSAHVRVEFYLLNVASGDASARSVFEEKQVGLTENLLTMAEFIKRRGKWVTATDLAVEGMRKAIKDLNL